MKQLISVLLFFFGFTSYAQHIENVTFVNQGNTIVITYDFEGCTTDDIYMVQVKFKEQGGGEVVPKTLSGDIQKVTCGSKRIVWDVFKDRTTFEGKYYVELAATIMPKGPPTDSDGYSYKTVQIGDQVWFAENLRTSKYSDGKPIPHVTDNYAWSKLNTGAYCFYDNNAANNATYGKLYNWYAVETDKLCPMGWHVPSDAEWTVLETYLGNEAGKKMKSTSGWYNNGNGTNSSGFSAYPAGVRNENGSYNVKGDYGFWWSSIPNDILTSYFRKVYFEYLGVFRSNYDKRLGLSVRCLKNSEILNEQEKIIEKPAVVEETPEEVFTFVEESPEFPGGAQAMMQFLSEHVVYPDEAVEQQIQGKVYVKFVIEKDGRVSNVSVSKGMVNCSECNENAIKLVRKMPNFKPGKSDGKAVRSYFQVPVSFVLE